MIAGANASEVLPAVVPASFPTALCLLSQSYGAVQLDRSFGGPRQFGVVCVGVDGLCMGMRMCDV